MPTTEDEQFMRDVHKMLEHSHHTANTLLMNFLDQVDGGHSPSLIENTQRIIQIARDAQHTIERARSTTLVDEVDIAPGITAAATSISTCRVCGCTDLDCSGCITRTGQPCFWVEPDLCSACAPRQQVIDAIEGEPNP